MDEETWILPDEALEYGFATAVTGAKAQEKYSQSVRKIILQKLTGRLPLASILAPKIDEPKENNLLKMFANIKEI